MFEIVLSIHKNEEDCGLKFQGIFSAIPLISNNIKVKTIFGEILFIKITF